MGVPPQEERRGVRHRRARRVPNFASMNHCRTARTDCPNVSARGQGTCARLFRPSRARATAQAISIAECREARFAVNRGVLNRRSDLSLARTAWMVQNSVLTFGISTTLRLRWPDSFLSAGLAPAGAHLALRSAQKLANLGRSRKRASRVRPTHAPIDGPQTGQR
jgi:hypothetical protein